MAARWAGVMAEFDGLPRYKQVEIVALYEISWRMEAVNAHEARPKPRRKRA